MLFISNKLSNRNDGFNNLMIYLTMAVLSTNEYDLNILKNLEVMKREKVFKNNNILDSGCLTKDSYIIINNIIKLIQRKHLESKNV